MLRRLLAFLLIFGLALPALGAPVAAAHGAATVMIAHHGHPMPDHDPAPARHAAKHDCIGCAPGTTFAPTAAEARPITPLAPAPRALAELHGHFAGPEAPPPRALA
jgi:hypothetical protein